MERILTEIDGSETKSGYGGPLDALIEFYRVFNAADLAGLKSVWLDGAPPSMDNPIGGIQRVAQIADGYAKLFEGRAKVNVTFHDFTSQGGDGWHLLVGQRGACRTPLRKRWRSPSAPLAGSFVTTGRGDSFTITDRSRTPKMLASYQKLILG